MLDSARTPRIPHALRAPKPFPLRTKEDRSSILFFIRTRPLRFRAFV